MPKVAGKRIILIGDSLSAGSQTPGGVMAQALRDAGAQVTVLAQNGRSAYGYMASSGGSELSGEAPPDLAIIMLGTNDIDLNNDSATAAALRQIADLLAPADVWGIGPPSFPGNSNYAQNVGRMVELERAVYGSDRFIDARAMTPQTGRSPDGIHFGAGAASEFGASLASAFQARGSPWAAVAVAVALGLAAYLAFG